MVEVNSKAHWSSVYDILFEAVNHHGIFGGDGQAYSVCAREALETMQQKLSNKVFTESAVAQVIQTSMRDPKTKTAMQRLKAISPNKAGEILGECVVNNMSTTKRMVESIVDTKVVSLNRQVPILNLPSRVRSSVLSMVPGVMEQMTGNYYDVDKIDTLVEAYDVDGSDGSHWIMEIVGRGSLPYRGYSIILTNPRGYISEIGAGPLTGAGIPNIKGTVISEMVSKSQPTDFMCHDADTPLDDIIDEEISYDPNRSITRSKSIDITRRYGSSVNPTEGVSSVPEDTPGESMNEAWSQQTKLPPLRKRKRVVFGAKWIGSRLRNKDIDNPLTNYDSERNPTSVSRKPPYIKEARRVSSKERDIFNKMKKFAFTRGWLSRSIPLLYEASYPGGWDEGGWDSYDDFNISPTGNMGIPPKILRDFPNYPHELLTKFVSSAEKMVANIEYQKKIRDKDYKMSNSERERYKEAFIRHMIKMRRLHYNEEKGDREEKSPNMRTRRSAKQTKGEVDNMKLRRMIASSTGNLPTIIHKRSIARLMHERLLKHYGIVNRQTNHLIQEAIDNISSDDLYELSSKPSRVDLNEAYDEIAKTLAEDVVSVIEGEEYFEDYEPSPPTKDEIISDTMSRLIEEYHVSKDVAVRAVSRALQSAGSRFDEETLFDMAEGFMEHAMYESNLHVLDTSPKLLKVLAKNRLTPQEALALGWSSLLGLGFAPYDIVELKKRYGMFGHKGV